MTVSHLRNVVTQLPIGECAPAVPAVNPDAPWVAASAGTARREMSFAQEVQFRVVLTQLGMSPTSINATVAALRAEHLTHAGYDRVLDGLRRDAAYNQAKARTDQPSTWDSIPGSPYQSYPPTKLPPEVGSANPWLPPIPGQTPIPAPDSMPPSPDAPTKSAPQSPPSDTPRVPAGKVPPTPTPDAPGKHHLAPWLIGAGVIGGGALIAAMVPGMRNVRALAATNHAFTKGTLGFGSTQALTDAQVGARFASGIGTGDYLSVALPFVRSNTRNTPLVAATRGHLAKSELLAAAAGMHYAGGTTHVEMSDSVRRTVQRRLAAGDSMSDALAAVSSERTGMGGRAYFGAQQLDKYYDRNAFMAVGSRGPASEQVLGGRHDAIPGTSTGPFRQPLEFNRINASHDARLGTGDARAQGLGMIQGLNVEHLRTDAARRAAAARAGIDQHLADTAGYPAAFTERWRDRLGS